MTTYEQIYRMLNDLQPSHIDQGQSRYALLHYVFAHVFSGADPNELIQGAVRFIRVYCERQVRTFSCKTYVETWEYFNEFSKLLSTTFGVLDQLQTGYQSVETRIANAFYTFYIQKVQQGIRSLVQRSVETLRRQSCKMLCNRHTLSELHDLSTTILECDKYTSTNLYDQIQNEQSDRDVWDASYVCASYIRSTRTMIRCMRMTIKTEVAINYAIGIDNKIYTPHWFSTLFKTASYNIFSPHNLGSLCYILANIHIIPDILHMLYFKINETIVNEGENPEQLCSLIWNWTQLVSRCQPKVQLSIECQIKGTLRRLPQLLGRLASYICGWKFESRLLQRIIRTAALVQAETVFCDTYIEHVRANVYRGLTLDDQREKWSAIHNNFSHPINRFLFSSFTIRNKNNTLCVLKAPECATHTHIPPNLIPEIWREYTKPKGNNKRISIYLYGGTAELMCRLQTDIMITCTTIQMIILLMFNTRSSITWQEILVKIPVEEYILRNHLLSLAHPSVSVLRKNPNKTQTGLNDVFSLNTHLSSTCGALIVPLMSLTNQSSSGLSMTPDVPSSNARLTATIIRFMKQKRQVNHIDLLRFVRNSVHIPMSLFLKQIDALIKQGYIRRNNSLRSLYEYVP